MVGIERFLDPQGRLKVWPSKQADKKTAIGFLAAKFEQDRRYDEKEVNELLKEWHTFSDWPLLRRELVDRGYLARNSDGSDYHLQS